MIMTLYIKNMVCDRCKLVVRRVLEGMALSPIDVRLCEVTMPAELTLTQHAALVAALRVEGFELLDDRRQQLVELTKTALIELVYGDSVEMHRVTPSVYVSEKLHRDYKYLSGLFSESEDITIEEYTIRQKIERVKELLTYDELSLTQIADRLHYSSVQYLSNQFKKMTGLTPRQYKYGKLPLKPPDPL